MRIALAVLLVAVVTGLVLHERAVSLERRLGGVASALAGKPVHVHCQGVVGRVLDVGVEQGSVWFGADGRPADTTDLKRPICGALGRYRGDVGGTAYACVVDDTPCWGRVAEDVLAVHVLAHEARHLAGERGEPLAECHGLQTTAQAAELLGADPARAAATARYALLHVYPQLPPEYRDAGCRDGGPLDLRPGVAAWP